MTFYPKLTNERISLAEKTGKLANANARATCAALECGCVLRYQIFVEGEEKKISDARFRTNGCGFVVAASEVLLQEIIGKRLTELHGLADDELHRKVYKTLGEFPSNREHCLNLCIETLHQTLADFRANEIENWNGDEVLICTCFGVSEKRIEEVIAENPNIGVKDIGLFCGAGRGCGSCQPLIREILDSANRKL